ncbi:hypothetical protein P153DRAFT_384695 [Dothidotthia symphoricarpi CBS 119687]|uniref:Defect at low temperature protein 1 n=1 Tax=Dothidotthia symphoricarpi CBS 119687 TaxID=1392245 RepID=A0A6A6AHS3_9PLEO|nr:uncharacterized protein P153DRAFT_384695 [Dothidotthia symphoricarpi CBS 119687]KAF2130424.1 hypothetical protein P153DRAFT_384695 [Dothidotthia symphoricarpi CBS 119687]
MGIPRIPLFRIWYSSTYTILVIILLLLLAISPADTIYQSIKTRELQKMFVVGGAYLLTGLIILLVYSTRIYTNRTVLGAIPKAYVPVEDGEVGRLVRKMIVGQLRRSAIVAWDSRPRDIREDTEEGWSRPATAEKDRHRKKTSLDATLLTVSAASPPWGHVSHPGWASPCSPDLPNLQYWSVICELPNLIEAKAVSLAPPDPTLEDTSHLYPGDTPLLPDAQIVTLLQRPRTMGLRSYLARLASFGLLNPPTLGPTFLAQYEYARFSTDPLTEPQFRATMSVFAEILNGMTMLDPLVIEEARARDDFPLDADDRSLAPTESTTSSSSSSTSSAHMPYRTPQLSRQRTHSLTDTMHTPHTARGTSIRNRSSGIYATPRTSSGDSTSLSDSSSADDAGSVVVRSQRPRPASVVRPGSSTESLGSVIRLHPNPSLGELPYMYQFQGRAGYSGEAG